MFKIKDICTGRMDIHFRAKDLTELVKKIQKRYAGLDFKQMSYMRSNEIACCLREPRGGMQIGACVSFLQITPTPEKSVMDRLLVNK